MALKKFVGARYAPQFMGAWNQATQYAALSVVYADQRSYVSRKTVPAGTAITNQEFWIQSSDWNAQVAEYNQKVDSYNANVEQYNKNVEDYQEAVSTFYADTLHSYGTKAAMQSDKTLKLGETLLTCGDKAIGDGGGSFYQVVGQTSVTAVALDNGLFAEPFEFQPYDYSQFQTEVEGYKKSTTRVYQNNEAMIADTGITVGDTLMTNGATTAGDGKGRFWNVTEEASSNSRRLNNGKYATPFMLASVDTANMLYFNSQGAQPAIWGIKEGSDAVSIPMELSEGDIKTVYVAVEYTTGGKGATINLEVSGTQNFTKAFAFNESAPSSGTYKTVLYAITGKSEGGSVYTGYSTVTSYNTSLDKYIAQISVGIPTLDNPLWQGSNSMQGLTYIAGFTVSKKVIIKSFTVNAKRGSTSVPANHELAASIVKVTGDNKYENVGSEGTIKLNSEGNFVGTVEANAEVAPGNTYAFRFYTDSTTSLFAAIWKRATPTPAGTYGPFTLTNDTQYSGIITYTETE